MISVARVAAVTAKLDGALCFGVTVMTGAPIHDAIRVSQAAKAFRSDLPVVWFDERSEPVIV